jgi:hypothetical protein
MSFIGNADFDMDLSVVVDAFTGRFTLADLLGTPSGLQTLALFATGTLVGLSFPWLGHSLLNLTLAIFYTVYKRTGKPKFAQQFLTKMKRA